MQAINFTPQAERALADPVYRAAARAYELHLHPTDQRYATVYRITPGARKQDSCACAMTTADLDIDSARALWLQLLGAAWRSR